MTTKELRALHAAATPGKWKVSKYLDGGGVTVRTADAISARICVCTWHPNTAIIVAAHNALPALLDRVEELEAALAATTHQSGVTRPSAPELAEEMEAARIRTASNGWLGVVDKLRARIAELEEDAEGQQLHENYMALLTKALGRRPYSLPDGIEALVAERDALLARIAELERTHL